jgi:hemerythrin
VTDFASHPSVIAGVQAMEDQHGMLVDSLNAIGQQLTGGRAVARLKDQIARLVEFSDLHFGCEESLLQRYGYPRLEEHRRAHRTLMSQFKAAVHRAERGEDVELERVLASVRGQYLEHVEQLDRAYSHWLSARGVY